jgi:hypothetical protein
MDNVWQGPYVVVNKAEEWHYYTIERDGIQRRATASQLRRYYSGGVGRDIHFNDDTPECDVEDNYESMVFEEASFTSANDADKRPVYYSDTDIASEEEVNLPRSRQAPKLFPEGQWTRSVAKMANVNKVNVSDTEPLARQSERLRVVLTRLIIVGRIKKNSSLPSTRTRNAGSGTPGTAEQRAREIVRALQALYVRRAKKGKWRIERSNDGPLRPPKTEPSAGENDVSSDSGDSQPCGLQATLSHGTETANRDFNDASRAAGNDTLQTLADPCAY